MAGNLPQRRPNLLVRAGLHLLSVGITIGIINFLFLAICALCNYKATWVAVTGGWISFVAGLFNVTGLLFCLLSGQKRFLTSLIFYIIAFAFAITIAALGKETKPWIFMVHYGILALSHLSFVLGLRELGARSPACLAFNFTCVFFYVIGIIIYWFRPGIGDLFVSIGNIFFLICILLTNKAVKIRR